MKMTNIENELKLQAFLDGELSGREAAEVRDLLARDAGMQDLMGELRNTKTALAGNEPERRLPESREFFWSKIEREIERQSEPVRPVARRSWRAWLQGRMLALCGAAVASVVLAFMAIYPPHSAPGFSGEMELASDDMGSYTYRDQSSKMTMVWLYDRNTADSQFTENTDTASVVSE